MTALWLIPTAAILSTILALTACKSTAQREQAWEQMKGER